MLHAVLARVSAGRRCAQVDRVSILALREVDQMSCRTKSHAASLITGASSGIGRATADLFAAKGAGVVIAARRQDELDSLVADIEARGGTASAVRTDVPVSADVGRMVDHAITTFGRLDYAISNAGIEGPLAGITELQEDEWDRVLGINLKGTFLCMQREAWAMLAAGHGGAIVNVGSVNSFLGFAAGSAIAPRSTA